MREPTQADVIALLGDPQSPRARGLKTEQAVPVWSFIRFAKVRGFATSGVEALTDRVVRDLGGTREPVIDPWRWLTNLPRRATGGLTMLTEDLWLLPALTRPSDGALP